MSKSGKKPRIAVASEEDVRKYARESSASGKESQASAGVQEGESGSRSATEQAETPAEVTGLQELQDKLLRARAEAANVQRRATKEKETAVRFAVAGFARDILEVLDDFERAFEATEASHNDQAIVDGARLVYEKMLKVLQNHHVERIEAEGQDFDPTVHEAVMQQPSAEHAAQTVLQEVQKGYRLWDRLLRPAKVIVSAPPREPEQSTGADTDENEKR